MSSAICLYGVACTARAILDKHLEWYAVPVGEPQMLVFSSVVMDFF